MKILLSILVVLSIEAKSQTLKDTLLSIQYESYLNKPIDSLLQILPQSYDGVYTRSGSSIFVGAIVSVAYCTDSIWIDILPGTHNFFIPLNSTFKPANLAWPLQQVKHELTWSVIVWSLNPNDPYPLLEIH